LESRVSPQRFYGVFLWKQIGSHKRLFIQPPPGSMVVRATRQARSEQAAKGHSEANKRSIVVRSCALLAMIVPIVLLAHYLAMVIDFGIAAAGAPVAVGGVFIAIIVFTPESLTAIRSALHNEMQRAINLCLGASCRLSA
jgi:Ca2+:H+ antiporter